MDNKKTLQIIGGTVLVAIAGYILYKTMSSSDDDEAKKKIEE